MNLENLLNQVLDNTSQEFKEKMQADMRESRARKVSAVEQAARLAGYTPISFNGCLGFAYNGSLFDFAGKLYDTTIGSGTGNGNAFDFLDVNYDMTKARHARIENGFVIYFPHIKK